MPTEDVEPTSQASGLTTGEVSRRLERFGLNRLTMTKGPSAALIFLRQFLSPLIYILLAAALVSLATGEAEGAIFIAVVLIVNAVIGTVQEYSAERAAVALRQLQAPRATVWRDGKRGDIDAGELVPGDVVFLAAGEQVPADILLDDADDLQCDESLLTGESAPVPKQAARPEGPPHPGTRVLAGTLVTRGRAIGTVEATGSRTELGRIAGLVMDRRELKAPLLVRLEQFSHAIVIAVAIALAGLFTAGLLQGMALRDLFLMSVGLAVSAIPEGLPAAVSIALAVGIRRMARENVIVRNLPAIEALGSCTLIATDKTGTLTMNELTVVQLCLPDGTQIEIGVGSDRASTRISATGLEDEAARSRAASLMRAASLANEAVVVEDGTSWTATGDTVDVALLAAARKCGLDRERLVSLHPLMSRIAYEPDLRFAASFHRDDGRARVFAKGDPETIAAMSSRALTDAGEVAIDRAVILAQQSDLTTRGFRVLAFAEGVVALTGESGHGRHHLVDLVFLGLAAMRDPLRPEVPAAVAACAAAGVQIVMITGDDAGTAAAIAKDAGLQFAPDQIVTGSDVQCAEEVGPEALDGMTRRARIYARVQPVQKLAIVLSLARNGHFVAVTGDGVNDAPALRQAHVGVAMGRSGTAVARESADIVITDDNFASVVAGIRLGRVAYSNIRKVVFMVVSTGAAEVLLFLLALPLGLPMPLLPVQLLWLNLVTNGIQDVVLAAQKPEGDELSLPPRRPTEPIFNRLMVRRVTIAALVMGIGGTALFWWLIDQRYPVDEARNRLLLLLVLFENLQTLNSYSERRSVLSRRLAGNWLLVAAVLASQMVHTLATFVPAFRDTLSVQPVTVVVWLLLAALASTVLVVMEVDKRLERRSRGRQA